jgi:hypothetical protein
MGALTALLKEIEVIHKGHEEFIATLELGATKLSGIDRPEARNICLEAAETLPPFIRQEMGVAPRP